MRLTIGLFAVLLLVAGFLLPSGDSLSAAGGACLRVGILMGLWWFAYPQVSRIPRWLAIAVGVGVLAVLLRPKLIVLVIPVLALLWFLGPRTPRTRSGAA